MASEISITGSLGVTNAAILSSPIGRAVNGVFANMAGTTYIEATMNCGTSATAIPLGGVTQPHWAFFNNMASLGTQFSITGAVSNAGAVKLTISSTSTFTTGQAVLVTGVLGTVEANGDWLCTVTDSTHLTLQSTTFTNTYVSGGTVQLTNRITIRNGSGGTDVIQLNGGECAFVPLYVSSTPYVTANVANTVMEYLIVNV